MKLFERVFEISLVCWNQLASIMPKKTNRRLQVYGAFNARMGLIGHMRVCNLGNNFQVFISYITQSLFERFSKGSLKALFPVFRNRQGDFSLNRTIHCLEKIGECLIKRCETINQI